jgi:FKBP-type peptidyl-prolyl cis-trans isomerase
LRPTIHFGEKNMNLRAIAFAALAVGALAILLPGFQDPRFVRAEEGEGKEEKAAPPFKTEGDRMSYALGVRLGDNVRNTFSMVEFNVDMMILGLRDGLRDKPQLKPEEIGKMLEKAQMEQRKRQAAVAEENLKKGQAFLAENAKKEGITITPSGLQYKVVKEGDGPNPAATDTVTVHYRGTTIDGTEFDSSFSRNQPATFALNRVIRGWTEGLALMKVGAKYIFYIPAKLAYGMRSPTPKIPPNSVLIFEVELLGIRGK